MLFERASMSSASSELTKFVHRISLISAVIALFLRRTSLRPWRLRRPGSLSRNRRKACAAAWASSALDASNWKNLSSFPSIFCSEFINTRSLLSREPCQHQALSLSSARSGREAKFNFAFRLVLVPFLTRDLDRGRFGERGVDQVHAQGW